MWRAGVGNGHFIGEEKAFNEFMNNNSLDFDWEITGLAHLVVVAWWFSVLELVVAKLDSDSVLSRLGVN